MNEGQVRCCYHKMGQPLHLVGKIAKDPRVTYEARIIDHIEIKNNKARFAVETTCKTVSKRALMTEENRIRENGGHYIRDRKKRQIIGMSDMQTRTSRRK